MKNISAKDLLQRTIERGIASVKSDSEMHPNEIEGSIEGFEACRELDVSSPDAMAELLRGVGKEIGEAFCLVHEDKMSLYDYWKMRYKEIQIEYVFEIMKFAWLKSGHHFDNVSARSAVKFNEIISG